MGLAHLTAFDMEDTRDMTTEEEIIAKAGPQESVDVPDALQERIQSRMREMDRAEKLLQEAIQSAALALEVPEGYQYKASKGQFVPAQVQSNGEVKEPA